MDWILLFLLLFRISSVESLSGSSLFKFGVISDIQFAQSSDAWNFQRTKLRRYRNSFQIYQEALQYWEGKQTLFNLILGDIIDIRASFSNSQESCLNSLLQSSSSTSTTSITRSSNYYCFGNHCLTCFPRSRLKKLVSNSAPSVQFCPSPPSSPDDHTLAYFWYPSPQWCFISLDSYEVSLVNPLNPYYGLVAKRLIQNYNPNDLTQGKSWYENLPRDRSMWTPNNGGISTSQLLWLDQILKHSAENKQKVVVFSHQPVYSPNNPTSLVWNHRAVLSILWKYNHIVLWLAGHDHEGQSHIDDRGIYHLVPPAPIEADINDQTYGVFEVFDDHLLFDWKGKMPHSKNCIQPWPSRIRLQ